MKKRNLAVFLLAVTLMLAMTLSAHASSVSSLDANKKFTFSLSNNQAATCPSNIKTSSSGRTNLVFSFYLGTNNPGFTVTVYGPYFPASGKSHTFAPSEFPSVSYAFDGTQPGGTYTFKLTPAQGATINGKGDVMIYNY